MYVSLAVSVPIILVPFDAGGCDCALQYVVG